MRACTRGSRTWPGAVRPTAHVIREALERYVSDQEAQLEPEPLPDWVGMLEGPGGPYAERDEEILDEGWADDLGPSPGSDTGAEH